MSSSSDNYEVTSNDEFGEDSVEVLYKIVKEAREYVDTASSSRRYVARDREEALQLLMADYFNEGSVYDDTDFRETFRVPKRLFLEMVERIKASGHPYFQEGYDARGKKSFTILQKCLASLQQLADGNPAIQNDKYFKMAGRTARECLQNFCDVVCDLYRHEYLRRPTSHDVVVLQAAHEELHHIPGMLGSIDCTHFEWRMCPKRLQGQYKRGCYPHPTIMLEAVASWDLWLWHAFFGPPGSNNDINVLNSSPLFTAERNKTAPPSSFNVNGRFYKRGYYLTDGGYPNWSTFVKAYAYPTETKEKRFKKLQESARKDVERAFGVLKTRWKILDRPLRQKTTKKIAKVVYTCIILHNMLIKEDGRAICPVYIPDQPVQPVLDLEVIHELRDADMCARLRFDLTEHVAGQDLPHLNDPEEAAETDEDD